MLVMDSGLGGLSVVRALRAAHPGGGLVYVADTAYFPYGARAAEMLSDRAEQLLARLHQLHPLDTVVLACNTLSTLCLGELRARMGYHFVGTVPAIKTAAELSRTRRFGLLATPNTADSRYTNDLIAQFASDCEVDAVGAPALASMAERMLLGETIPPAELAAAIAPAFGDGARKTDAIVLGCTHYPLIQKQLEEVAPWPVRWIDSGEAIARRALSLMAEETMPADSIAYVTRAEDVAAYAEVFSREGFAEVRCVEAVTV